jgi:hypothetical protein
MERASSTSMPRYLTVLSILVWPSNSCTARRSPGSPVDQCGLCSSQGMGAAIGTKRTSLFALHMSAIAGKAERQRSGSPITALPRRMRICRRFCSGRLEWQDSQSRSLCIRRAALFRWCLTQCFRAIRPMALMTIGEYREPRGSYFPSVLY